MKFLCDKQHVFMIPAKRTVNSYSPNIIHSELPNYTGNIPPTYEPAQLLSMVEFSECPICQSKVFSEVVEDELVDNIESIKQVPYSEADALLKQGYVKGKEYAKEVVMVKKKVSQP